MKATKDKNTPAVKVKPASGIAARLDCEIVRDRRIKLTKEMAYHFLELDTFQGERIVNENHVQMLYNAWSSGRFMWEHVIIALCECQGKTYRINGQHTCWMRVNMERDDDVTVREIVYRVDDESNLRALYSTFDQNKQRTPAHVMKALLVGTHVATDIWPSIIGPVTAGLKMYLYEGKVERRATVADLAEIINNKMPDLFKQVALFYQTKYDTYHTIRRRASVAALFATFEAAPQKAYDFWTPICDQLGFTGKDDMRLKLRQFMDTHIVSKTRSSGNYVLDEDMYRISVNAWNRWRKGETVQRLFPTDRRVKAI